MAKQNSSKVELVDERFVPLDEAFATLGVSPSKGYLLAREGKLPIRKAGRKRVFLCWPSVHPRFRPQYVQTGRTARAPP